MRLRLPFSPRHIALVPISALMLLPLVWMFVTSVETLDQTRHFPPTLIPSGIHWSNYSDAWNQAPFGRFFVNSLIVTGTAVAGNLLFCSLAGYAFARLRFLGREVLFIALLATLMVPFQVIMIPTFLIVQHLGLVDSLGGLIAPNLVTPFGIFLLRQFFRTLPVELEEAARIDGCSRLGVLFRIVLPLSLPGAGDARDRHVPVDVERLPVAADRDHLDRPEHGAARPRIVPGRARRRSGTCSWPATSWRSRRC